MGTREGWRGRFFEDFEVGDVYEHPLGRTVTTTDNMWFTLLTQNTAPIHVDHAYAAQTEFGRPLVDSTFTLALVTGQSLMRFKAAELFGSGEPCGAEANMAKLLAADASWEAANVAMQTYGGYGYDAEYDVERKFRETRLFQVAPISTNLILSYVAEHVLGLPRSF